MAELLTTPPRLEPPTPEPLQPFEHVVDSGHFEFFDTIHWQLHLPTNLGLPEHLEFLAPFGLTKFMLVELLVAIFMLALFIPLARRVRTGEPPRGLFQNFGEALLEFVRDQIARPALGANADKFLPFLWTLFTFVLLNNLFGMLPFMPSPTASIMVTGSLAIVCFFVVHGFGIKENGVGGYLKSFVPHIESEPGPMKIFISFLIVPGIAALEIMTAFLRFIILAVRLFCNMLAGHTVLFVLLLFIRMTGSPSMGYGGDPDSLLFYIVTPLTVLLVTALSVLELFIAGLQAFIFAFLTAVFLGLALHPEH
jgi:F-type H+-transporting ATPase subunit a